ncbi:DUF2110 family protein [Salinarchaeum sp. IM2453]|uniref:DUF2110 family protein n=1 Tax=Salinarchaeum sp. IM2453 TaxID=2862870 RepID=UPI001C82FC60|nr:DUF2110 family protein [Salinarchaeum sp. IM2453]QZA88685.1 DUF2110 family protein [Salinarchaeum sp. IM2453]
MVVIATKIYVEGQAQTRAMQSLESIVNNLFTDLDVDVDIGLRHDSFPSVTVSGPDEVVARNLLRDEFGEIPSQLEEGNTYIGTLEEWSDTSITLDAGTNVEIPADRLGLGPGKPSQLRERFGLVQHLPMEFEYGSPSSLTDAERDRLYEWQRGNGRVNVNSVTRSEARATVNRAGHANDIITVERLGLLEQSIICTEDTDPPGLIAAIGEYLPAELRAVVP